MLHRPYTSALPNSTSPEEKLKISELRYRRLFETAQDGILILDAHSGKIADANPFLKRILGYSQSELLGKELWEIGVFKDIKESKSAFLELQTKGYIRYKDLPLQTKDGRKIDVEFVSNVYMVGTQKVVQCNIRDITERRLSEEKVTLTQTQLVLAQEIAKLGSWKLDLKTNRVDWSNEMYRIYGYPDIFAITLEKAMERVHPSDVEQIQSNIKKAIAAFKPPKFVFPGIDYRIILPNNKVRIMHGEGALFADGKGNPTTMVGIVQDITDSIASQEKLETNNQELEKSKKAIMNVMEDLEAAKAQIELEKAKDEAMLASLGEGLVAVDNNKKIILMNKIAQDMLGWKTEEVIGKSLSNFSLEDEAGHQITTEKHPISIALLNGKSANSIFFYVKKNKTRLPLAITVTPIVLNTNKIGAIIILRDVTLEREVDRAKSEFVSLASHQLRTPLGIVKWYLEAIENDPNFKKTPIAVRKYFNEIYKSNERVLSLVRDLLSVSRIEQGIVKNVPKPVNPTQIITEIVRQMKIAARKKKLALHLSITNSKIPSVTIDILRFHEVIENLISNAIAYTEAAGDITVNVKKHNNDVLISIKDTGIGISETDQKKLFTKFFRSEKAVSYNSEGSGLGLYVVKSYIEGWGGSVSAESTEGKGSIFTVSLPTSQSGHLEERRSKVFYKHKSPKETKTGDLEDPRMGQERSERG